MSDLRLPLSIALLGAGLVVALSLGAGLALTLPLCAALIFAGMTSAVSLVRTRIAGRRLAEDAERLAAGERVNPRAHGGPLSPLAAGLDGVAARIRHQEGTISSEDELLAAVLTGMEDGILVLRGNGRLLLANAAAHRLLALPRDAEERPLSDSLRLPALLDAAQAALDGRATPFELFNPAGKGRTIVGRAAPLAGRGHAAAVIVLQDVTEIRRLEVMRRDFVASASHELRTPVATIRGYAETLASGALDDREAATRFVSGLARQAERLTALIDDLLDLSRVESGGMRLQAQAVPVGSFLERVAAAAQERADAKSLRVAVDPVDPSVAALVDPKGLEMVIGNLLDNALKYTPEGGSISLGASQREGAVRLEVRDTGPGIEPRHQARIFERFYRADAGRARDVGGTGLGLAIAKHVAQQSGGDVGVESRPGAGSCFWIRLPAPR